MQRSILQLISSSGLYGAEKVLLELADFLKDEGWLAHVGVFVGPKQHQEEVAEEARRRGLTTVLFPTRGQFDTKTLREVRNYVSAHGIDVIHSHGYKTDVFLALAQLPLTIKRVATCHSWCTCSLKLLLYEFLDKIALHQLDHVVLVSPQLVEDVAAAGIPLQRRSLIENGVRPGPQADPTVLSRLRQELRIEPEEKLLLRVGRLDINKGNHILLRAMSQVLLRWKVKLVFAGNGEDRQKLEQQSEQLSITHSVIFAGYRTDIPALLQASDLFVICSANEGLPMVLLEAMAARVPVISTAVGAIPSVIRHGVEGTLIPPNDPQALAAAITEAIQWPVKSKEMAEKAHERFRRDYSQRAMGQKYLALYESLLALL